MSAKEVIPSKAGTAMAHIGLLSRIYAGQSRVG